MERHKGLREHRWLRKIFDRPWWQIFLLLALPGVLLHAVAPLFDAHSIEGHLLAECLGDEFHSLSTCDDLVDAEEQCPPSADINNGFWFQANWLIVIPMLIPLLLATLSVFVRKYFDTIDELQHQSGVLVLRQGFGGANFADVVSTRLGSLGARTFWTCVTLALVISYVDTIDLTAGYHYYQNLSRQERVVSEPAYAFDEEDWSVAFSARGDWTRVCLGGSMLNGASPPNRAANVLFNLAVYSVQGFFIFLAFFWVAKVWQALFVFSRALEGEEAMFRLELNEHDRKLGLGGLGAFYNAFLTCIVGFESYVLLHRLQQVELAGSRSAIAYLEEIISSPLGSVADSRLAAGSSIDGGQAMLLFGIALPVAVVCWLPVVRIRNYIGRKKVEQGAEFARQMAEARAMEDEELVQRYEKRIKRLESANIWPNGDKVATNLLLLTGVIWLSAFYPPAIPLLWTGGLFASLADLARTFVGPGSGAGE